MYPDADETHDYHVFDRSIRVYILVITVLLCTGLFWLWKTFFPGTLSFPYVLRRHLRAKETLSPRFPNSGEDDSVLESLVVYDAVNAFIRSLCSLHFCYTMWLLLARVSPPTIGSYLIAVGELLRTLSLRVLPYVLTVAIPFAYLYREAHGVASSLLKRHSILNRALETLCTLGLCWFLWELVELSYSQSGLWNVSFDLRIFYHISLVMVVVPKAVLLKAIRQMDDSDPKCADPSSSVAKSRERLHVELWKHVLGRYLRGGRSHKLVDDVWSKVPPEWPTVADVLQGNESWPQELPPLNKVKLKVAGQNDLVLQDLLQEWESACQEHVRYPQDRKGESMIAQLQKAVHEYLRNWQTTPLWRSARLVVWVLLCLRILHRYFSTFGTSSGMSFFVDLFLVFYVHGQATTLLHHRPRSLLESESVDRMLRLEGEEEVVRKYNSMLLVAARDTCAAGALSAFASDVLRCQLVDGANMSGETLPFYIPLLYCGAACFTILRQWRINREAGLYNWITSIRDDEQA